MKDKKKTKEYSNGELTIVWEPGICSHSEVCINCLPEVYNPYGKPWITIEKATTEQLKAQLEKCPSGALRYYMNDHGNKNTPVNTKAKVMANGPLILTGTFEVTNVDGSTEIKSKASFCRCGASAKQPYCDGSHKKIGFTG